MAAALGFFSMSGGLAAPRDVLEAEPTARECIFVVAEIYDFTAFFCPPGVEAVNINSSTIGTINPGNFSGQGDVVSPIQP